MPLVHTRENITYDRYGYENANSSRETDGTRGDISHDSQGDRKVKDNQSL